MFNMISQRLRTEVIPEAKARSRKPTEKMGIVGIRKETILEERG